MDVHAAMESDTTADPLDELTRNLYCPLALGDKTEKIEPLDSILSHVPWRLKSISKQDSNARALPQLPTYNYLDLRRQQNEAWAAGRLKEGNSLIFQDPQQAESLFKQGLDLVPSHVNLLIAYGKLLARTQRFSQATVKLQRALELDPECAHAKESLNRVTLQSKAFLQQSLRKQAPTTAVARESAIYSDVMFERSLRENSATRQEDLEEDAQAANDETVESTRDDRAKRKKQRKKRRHRRKKKRKRRRSRSPSYSSDSSSDYSSSSDSYKKAKRRRKQRPTASLSPASPLDSALADDVPTEDEDRKSVRVDTRPSVSDSPSSSVDDESSREARHRKHKKRRKESHSKKSKRKKRRHRRRDDSES